MSLTAINWRKLPRINLYVPASPFWWTIEAMYDVLAGLVYYDNSARAPGSGSAVTAGIERDTYTGGWVDVAEAVYFDYPAGALNHKGIIAGIDAASPSTKSVSPLTPDSWTKNVWYANTIKNGGGSYLGWNSGAVYSGGTAMGYWKCAPVSNPVVVDLYESQEGFAYSMWGQYGVLMGAVWDPQSTHALDAETDGRKYGMMTGKVGLNYNGWTYSIRAVDDWGTNNTFTDHYAADEGNHVGMFDPGAGSVEPCYRSTGYIGTVGNMQNQWVSVGGTSILMCGMPYHGSPYNSDYRFRGTSRQWGIGRAVPAGTVFQSAGVDKGFAAWSPTGGIYSGTSCPSVVLAA